MNRKPGLELKEDLILMLPSKLSLTHHHFNMLGIAVIVTLPLSSRSSPSTHRGFRNPNSAILP